MDTSLRFLPLAELRARANELADRCRACAAAGDDAGDAAAFEQLLPLINELERRSSEPAEPPLVMINPRFGGGAPG